MTEPRCAECGHPVDPDHPLTLREITGWSRERMQGGQNHVRFRTETGRLMCGQCAERIRLTGNASQTSLLGTEGS